MTTYSLCSPSLLALSFPPKTRSIPRNPRRARALEFAEAVAPRRVLGALYRLARESQPASLLDLELVIGCERAQLVEPLAQLANEGMVHRQGDRIALSLVGFAAAAALHTNARRS